MLRAVVVIPVVRPFLEEAEKVSLSRCLEVLGSWPIVLLSPADLDLTAIQHFCGDRASEQRFDPGYFKSIADYNRLMISARFYEAFADYDYMLLYQLDAYVFEDRLAEWCARGYDYVGAPALHQGFERLPQGEAAQYAKALDSHRVVFNGGLSLRKISAMKRLIKLYNFFFPAWPGNEDMLFSLASTRLLPLKPFMKLPQWRTALEFSFEKSPAASLEITKGKLPFGCHAWEKYDPAFWTAHIPDRP